ncbi:MAG: TIGR03085 family metal-binding protein [Corynebacterium sp.]|nr:TIGR03085 family metal-binding protein [Corynebacterium sp.]
MNVAEAERHSLASDFRQFGPHADTLCEGWQAKDLLIHLIIRENTPWLLGPGLQSKLQRRMAQLESQDFESLISQWDSQCYPKYLPLKFADRWINCVEHWVHHEDLRRAQGLQPRELDAATMAALYKNAKLMRFMIHNPHPVVVEPAGFTRIVAADRKGVVDRGDTVVHVRGEIGEIVLWIFGRPSDVTIEGDQSQLRLSRI